MGLYLSGVERTHSGIFDFYGDDSDDEGHHEIDVEVEDRITLTAPLHLVGRRIASVLRFAKTKTLLKKDSFDNGFDKQHFDRYDGQVT